MKLLGITVMDHELKLEGKRKTKQDKKKKRNVYRKGRK
jgi:hypothetical protein